VNLLRGKRYGKDLPVDASKLRAQERYYKSVADQLENLMNGLGTRDKQLILDLILPLNSEEIKHLHNAFGYRVYNDLYFGRPLGFIIASPGQQYDLSAWLRNDLSDNQDYLKQIKPKFIEAGLWL
jgi:hypothetical protein